MGAMLVVTTWYLKITTQHLQPDGCHDDSYHMDIIPENYNAAKDKTMGSILVVTMWYLKITTRHLQHDGRHFGSY
jgi:hypothetical protein